MEPKEGFSSIYFIHVPLPRGVGVINWCNTFSLLFSCPSPPPHFYVSLKNPRTWASASLFLCCHLLCVHYEAWLSPSPLLFCSRHFVLQKTFKALLIEKIFKSVSDEGLFSLHTTMKQGKSKLYVGHAEDGRQQELPLVTSGRVWSLLCLRERSLGCRLRRCLCWKWGARWGTEAGCLLCFRLLAKDSPGRL